MPRLRRSDCSGPGIARLRRGRGFTYRYSDGRPVEDEDVLERIRTLAVPPAWRDVWICLDELGHLQATGTDAAGRKQYLYHPLWHERRDRAKFDRMLRFAEAQPKLRRRVARSLSGDQPTRERVLACAVRMLDLGLFRVGSEEYAEEHGSFGLTTLRKEHVSVDGDALRFRYPSKSGVTRVHVVQEPRCAEIVTALRRRRGGPELLAYREDRSWHLLHAQQINDFLKAVLGEEFSAKDFRTWNATVIAATALSASAHAAVASSNGIPPKLTKTGRERAVRGAIKTVSESLGNTPAIARRSYIDPRVFDRYRSGWVISIDADWLNLGRDRDRRQIELAVIDLLRDDRASEQVERVLPPLRVK